MRGSSLTRKARSADAAWRLGGARLFATCAVAAVTLLAGGCASLPDHLAGPPSHAMAASVETPLGRIAKAAQTDPDLTGFRLLPGGDYALHARLELARRATRSLDVQYYHIENDATGRYFLRTLRDAALRGVRVRLLLDDLYTGGEDALLLGLAATPNLELRLFNPFPARYERVAWRFAASLLRFDQVQRRMHNKLFISDGAMAVAGGRNIGGRYFFQTTDENFIDLDTFVVGALVPRLGQLFDQYWNSASVVPIGRVASAGETPAELQRQFEMLTAAPGTPPPRPPPPNDLLGYGPLTEDLDAGQLRLVWSTAQAYADSPDRATGKTANYGGVPLLDVDGVRYNVIENMRRARKDVTMTSPYLVPGKAGLEVMRQARARGVSLSIVTNSFAATDEPLVHTAYRRYRRDMLQMGVELHELSSRRTRRSVRLGLFGSAIGRLHAKSAVIDRRILFVGSMNFDPRSESVNTELGLFIHSPTLAQQALKLVEVIKEQGAWRLQLAADGGSLEWHSSGPDGMLVRQEPDAGFWDLLLLELLAPLTPESVL
jgi:putative cardiolipin synthase